MKSFLLVFLSIFTFALLIEIDPETYGCKLPESSEGKDECCWTNSDACCEPPEPNQGCDMVITTCCKKRVVNELTGEITYIYSPGKFHYYPGEEDSMK